MRRRSSSVALTSAVSVWIARVWTVVVLGFVVSAFFRFRPVPDYAPLTYLLILGWYAIWNSVKLWGGLARDRRPGELIVYGWLALYAGLFVVDWASDRYRVEGKVLEVFFEIFSIFVASQISKKRYVRSLRRERRERHATRKPPIRHHA